MNREEIEWITRNLFGGNKLWSGEVKGASGKAFDQREIRSPIVLFASMGDNIERAAWPSNSLSQDASRPGANIWRRCRRCCVQRPNSGTGGFR